METGYGSWVWKLASEVTPKTGVIFWVAKGSDHQFISQQDPKLSQKIDRESDLATGAPWWRLQDSIMSGPTTGTERGFEA